MAFTTPPGLWHSHHNESGADAYLVPVQDAGLHNYMRTLAITFSAPAEH
jgi:gentisate 1,2-dioxygenase